jgi:3-deoxy-D-manno-octulosonic acid (KDO) 8-phosphate synthase
MEELQLETLPYETILLLLLSVERTQDFGFTSSVVYMKPFSVVGKISDNDSELTFLDDTHGIQMEQNQHPSHPQ